jgi:hypothetical protein
VRCTWLYNISTCGQRVLLMHSSLSVLVCCGTSMHMICSPARIAHLHVQLQLSDGTQYPAPIPVCVQCTSSRACVFKGSNGAPQVCLYLVHTDATRRAGDVLTMCNAATDQLVEGSMWIGSGWQHERAIRTIRTTVIGIQLSLLYCRHDGYQHPFLPRLSGIRESMHQLLLREQKGPGYIGSCNELRAMLALGGAPVITTLSLLADLQHPNQVTARPSGCTLQQHQLLWSVCTCTKLSIQAAMLPCHCL